MRIYFHCLAPSAYAQVGEIEKGRLAHKTSINCKPTKNVIWGYRNKAGPAMVFAQRYMLGKKRKAEKRQTQTLAQVKYTQRAVRAPILPSASRASIRGNRGNAKNMREKETQLGRESRAGQLYIRRAKCAFPRLCRPIRSPYGGGEKRAPRKRCARHVAL